MIAERPSAATPGERLLAAWDFSAGIEGTAVTDRGPHARHGYTVNLPARGVTGRSWDGSVADWRFAPEQYGAIHFHEDDLHDCRWSTDAAFEVPADWRSGFYAARLRAPGAVGYVPFFVRPPRGRANAPIALVASTATYMSYANTHIKFDSLNTENLYESLTPISEDELYLNEHRELGLSHYDTHADKKRGLLRLAPPAHAQLPAGSLHVQLSQRHPRRCLAQGARFRLRRGHRRGPPRRGRGASLPLPGRHHRLAPRVHVNAHVGRLRRLAEGRGPSHVSRGQRVLLAHRVQRRGARGHREPARDHRGAHLGGGAGGAPPLVHR